MPDGLQGYLPKLFPRVIIVFLVPEPPRSHFDVQGHMLDFALSRISGQSLCFAACNSDGRSSGSLSDVSQ